MMIDNATTYKTVFDKKGWVSANLLAVSTRGYDAGGVNLYEGGKGSKVLTKIPEDMEMKIVGCDGKRMQVKYKEFTGWLEPDARCDSAVTRCN
jgi:SH3-like domain-containing protein